MRGYKVFNSDWTCRGFQYAVGEIFEENVTPECCDRGFHYCKDLKDCFNYYNFNPENKVAEIIALGDIDEENDGKCCTNKIQIVKEISWEEVLRMVNLGKGCTGLCNSGNRNSGNRNSGDCNSGNRNSGDWNSGDWNSGNRNSGDSNSGDWNSGNRNSGNRNSGDWNSGDSNSGDWNSGNRNSGDWNSGDWNSGNRNSGDCNSGNRNSGDWNSGDWNSGDSNSGDWNSGDQSVGCFNTESQKLHFFDKETDMTFDEWRSSRACYLLDCIDFRPTKWIWESDMTDEEKGAHPEYKTCGGYLKDCDTSDCCIDWWNDLSNPDKYVIQNMPNFDAKKFYEITGIEV